LVATSGECLFLWDVGSDGTNSKLIAKLKRKPYSVPLTSFDWNINDPNMIGTASLDCTCTIWDISKKIPKCQIYTNTKEVFDITFCNEVNEFATAGADGNINLFDLRSIQSSFIIFQNPDRTPLVRVSWHRANPDYFATLVMNSNKVILLDKRRPIIPVMTLFGHNNYVNAVSWAPIAGY